MREPAPPTQHCARTTAGRQQITGVVVNERPNVPRRDYDRLKAILHDAVRDGAPIADRARLLGRISWVESLNPTRGAKLRARFDRTPGARANLPRRMARSWAELLGDAEGPQEGEEERRGFFGRLRESLSKSRRALTEQIAVAAFDPADDESWERLEEALIRADVGVRATAELVRRLEARQDVTELGEALAEEIAGLLGEPPTLDVDQRPTVILVVGVNGTGKTTTIGKLAQKLRQHGRDVTLGAADTFRAAAEEQLEIWAQRSGARFVGGERGGDPAAVAYDAVGAGSDVIIVDTAGRLHTQTNLMDELGKVRRVIAGRLEGAPHETLLIVDATTGQNGLQQARLFRDAVGVTGVALTKLDGSAKGGIAVAIAYELGLPVKLVGVGEGLEDLRPFDPGDFARALVAA